MEAGSALTFTEFSIDPVVRDGFGRWHSDEHAAERLEIPGVRSVRRDVSTSDPLHYCCCYVADSIAVFASAAYQALFENTSPLTKHMTGHLKGTRFVGDVVRADGTGHGGRLCRLRIAVEPDRDDEVVGWFDAEGARLLAAPGVVRITLARPRRDYPIITDPNWICLIEGYDTDTLGAIASSDRAAPFRADARTFLLEHLLP